VFSSSSNSLKVVEIGFYFNSFTHLNDVWLFKIIIRPYGLNSFWVVIQKQTKFQINNNLGLNLTQL